MSTELEQSLYTQALKELDAEAYSLNDGTDNRLDITNQLRCAIWSELEIVLSGDCEGVKETIDLVREKMDFILRTNWNGTNIELNQAMQEETAPDTL